MFYLDLQASQTDWSSFYAPGPEILKYLQSVVDKYKLMRYIKLEHEVVHARYDGPSGKWHIRVLRRPGEVAGSASSAREEFTDVADVLITAVGIFSKWNWPEIEGIQNFDGQLIHSASFGCQGQHWEDVVQDWGSKRVGVIGIVGYNTFCVVWSDDLHLFIRDQVQSRLYLHSSRMLQGW